MEQTFTLIKNTPIAKDVYKAVLRGDTSRITVPGQFVNIKLDGFFLRRPISVCDWTIPFMGDEGELTLIYKVVGKGTDAMSRMKEGQELNVLTGLGHGFDVSASGKCPLLVGGGVGTPPMYGLAKRLVKVNRVYQPDASNKAVYEKNYRVFKRLYRSNVRNFSMINGG